MSGLYLHIPFCKQACHYCNFHFSTSLKYKAEMLAAILRELELQKGYLEAAPLRSIYFGGGTPSLLEVDEIKVIFEKIFALYSVDENAEITLEANPDDLTKAKLAALSQTPINRLSIGIQSFSDTDLQYMNRAHNAQEAQQCIALAQDHGFHNLTVDLIYGTPTMDTTQWAYNIQQLLDLQIPHISCYCLTVEPQTALAHFVKTGKSKPVDDLRAEEQFLYLIDRLESEGYEHYEISNFAQAGHYAVHNSNYWLGETYLGIGPSAHSFNKTSRQWNIAHNSQYIKALSTPQSKDWYEKEALDADQRYNEYVMTRLRTHWGVVLADLSPKYRTHFLKEIEPYLQNEKVRVEGNIYRLTKSGRLLADRIASDVFY